MVHKNTDNGTSQSWQKGELCRGADIAFVFLFRQYCKSSHNGATEHQNQRSPGFPRVGTAAHQSGGDYRGQYLNLFMCGKCTYPLCICPFIPPSRPRPPLKLCRCGKNKLISLCNLTTFKLGCAVICPALLCDGPLITLPLETFAIRPPAEQITPVDILG